MTEIAGRERAKLIPTNRYGSKRFLNRFLPKIMDLNFTATVRKSLMILQRKKNGRKHFPPFDRFHPSRRSVKTQTEHRVGERILGDHPKTGNQSQ